MLSILTGSVVTVKVLQQKENACSITRESIIVSRETGKVLIRAQSKIFSSHLPPKVISQLKQKQAGIGTIINSFGLETFRKITEVGYDRKSGSVFRKYQIIYRRKVAFAIKEELLI
jgi:chorismate-pyruvate lyase